MSYHALLLVSRSDFVSRFILIPFDKLDLQPIQVGFEQILPPCCTNPLNILSAIKIHSSNRFRLASREISTSSAAKLWTVFE